MRSIKVTARPDGSVETETRGYEGPECQQADLWLRSALGVTRGDRPTAEAFVTPATQQQQQEVNGNG